MSRTPKHRAPIIDASITLFRRQGFARTGVNDIVDLCGAPKGSLYHYFPEGKVSIAVAAVEEAGQRVAATLHDLSERSPDTPTLLTAHADLLVKWLRASDFRDGCPITTVLLELAPQERGVTAAGRKAYGDRIRILRDKLLADGHRPERAQSLAQLCTSALQGALVQARVERSGKPIEQTAAELSRLIALP